MNSLKKFSTFVVIFFLAAGGVVVYNAEPRYASIISGIPGHNIEDVKLSNIRILYKGGGTLAQAHLQVRNRA